jgi:hypothetical protein
MEKRRPRVGDVVIFHDGSGKARNALLKAVWDQSRSVTDDEGNFVVDEKGVYVTEPSFASDDLTELPCVNLVYVSGDPSREDGCGRQTQIETSVVHKSHQAVHGNYWRFAWEDPNPYRAPSDV